eukprot:GHVN01057264.1.p1 GENE.GHVN01057264.1~~GHVN01057264.1.p1  ORF type:complete len:548 (+),score=87.99 GHVN01057264.1:69-1712(+)
MPMATKVQSMDAPPPVAGGGGKKIVFELLKTDAEHRKVGVTGDLFKFDQIQLNKEWDASLPTFVHEISYHKLRQNRSTLASFKSSLFNDFPELKKLNFENVLIAGGCVGHYMHQKHRYRGDVDIFIYGLTPAQADIRVCNLVKDLVKAKKDLMEEAAQAQQALQDPMNAVKNMNKTNPNKTSSFQVKLIRNKNGVSVYLGIQLFQIIFRLYTSPSEILHGFDIGSSAVGFDGDDLYFTSLARFAYEYMCNIIDTTRRSTTYERRLEKYWGRGFDLILPNLDMSKIRDEYLKFPGQTEMVVLPHFPVSYSQTQGNQINVRRFFRGQQQEEQVEDQIVVQNTDYSLDDINEYNLLSINMRAILIDPATMYHFHTFEAVVKLGTQADSPEDTEDGSDEEAKEKKTSGVKESEAQRDSNTIDDFFKQPPFLSEKSVRFFYHRLRRTVYCHKNLQVSQLEKFITVEPLSKITTRIFTDGEDAKFVLDDLVERQINHILTLLQSHKESVAIPWVTENPGTQLTSSINPVFESPEKWYGKYFVADSESEWKVVN